MADYNQILPTETDPGAPIRASLMKRLEANPRAMMEGASGGTRLRIGALQRLTAGDAVRANVPDAEQVISFVQAGSVRVKLNQNHNGSGQNNASVYRRRAGTNTTLQTWSLPGNAGTVSRSADVNVLPGDRIYVTSANTAGGGGTSNMQICTAGEDLFPAPDVADIGYVGNTYA